MKIKAIIKIGNKQFFITPNEYIITEKINLSIGEIFICNKILMINNKNIIKLGTPYLKNYIVKLKLEQNFKSKKIKIIKFKRRKHYKKQLGHRQTYSKLLVNEILKI